MRINFPALTEVGLRRYLTGQFVSFIGTWIQILGLNLLVFERTQSPWLLGLLNFLLYGPMLVVAPLAGSRLTHPQIKTILISVLLANAATSLVFACLVFFDQAPIWILLLLTLLSGTLSAIELPSRLFFITAFLHEGSLMTNALSLNVMANNFGRTVGAALGAIMFSLFGSTSTFFICSLGLIFMAACVYSIKTRAETGTRPDAGDKRLLKGLRYVRSEPFASFYLPVIGLLGLFAASYPTLVPLLGQYRFGHTTAYTGIFLGCAGAGAVAASVLLASRFSARALDWLRISYWTACASLLVVALSPTPLIASLAFFALGGSITFTNSASFSAMLQRSPQTFRGSVAGLYSMAFAGILPFGHLMAGGLSAWVGVGWTFAIMGAALGCCLMLLSLLHRSAFQRASVSTTALADGVTDRVRPSAGSSE
jgi:MFS family permease